MIFSCKDHVTWDTWMYFYGGKYYLYYLITDRSGGEGFGVAVSEDGIRYRDLGTAVTASEKMVIYLGTGAVWQSTDFPRDKTFICNYSEWRKDEETGENYQSIFFATSKDLIRWQKTGEQDVFCVDTDKYLRFEKEGGRWDCIYPHRTAEGYEGFFTATPKEYLGCGYAVSRDGLHWQAKKPPRFCTEGTGISECVEAGAVCVHGGRYYMLMGTYTHRNGMSVMVSDVPNGEYRPQAKNFALLSNNTFMHAYFMRIFEAHGKLYVNHHVLLRQANEYGRNTTFAAPLKEIDFDEEGILRLKWAALNEGLKGEEKEGFCFEEGFVLECTPEENALLFETEAGEVRFVFSPADSGLKIYEGGALAEEVKKDIPARKGRVRILYRDTLLEAYLDDWFLTCYTFKGKVTGIENADKRQIWRLNV